MIIFNDNYISMSRILFIQLFVLASLLASADTIKIKCQYLKNTWQPGFVIRELGDSIYMFERWTSTMHIMDENFKCDRHFKAFHRPDYPIIANDFQIDESGIYLLKDLGLIRFNSDGVKTGFFCINKRYNGYLYQKLYVPNMFLIREGHLYLNTVLDKDSVDRYVVNLAKEKYTSGIISLYPIPEKVEHPDTGPCRSNWEKE